MARETLAALLRLRRLAVDEAARALGAALREAEQAREALTQLTEMLAYERTVTRTLVTKETASMPFAAWEGRVRHEIVQARCQVTAKEAAVATAQETLGQSRSHLRALETAIARAEAEEAVVAGRAAQHTLDDVARRRTQAVDE